MTNSSNPHKDDSFLPATHWKNDNPEDEEKRIKRKAVKEKVS